MYRYICDCCHTTRRQTYGMYKGVIQCKNETIRGHEVRFERNNCEIVGADEQRAPGFERWIWPHGSKVEEILVSISGYLNK